MPRAAATLLCAAALAGGAAAQCRPRTAPTDISNHSYTLSTSSCPMHDPAIGAVVDPATGATRYFAYATDAGGPQMVRQWCSDDAQAWELCGHVLPGGLPAWTKALVPTATGVWAPDVSYFAKAGAFHVYYAVSEFGKRVSCIGLARSPVQDPADPAFRGWADSGGPVLCTNETDAYNAIDPNVVFDAGGAPYLVFGSFWAGIQAVPLDPATGLVPPGAKVTNIASRDQPGSSQAIEGAFMVRNGTEFWLFVSWNKCCQGAQSNYEVRVGRAPSPLGPFVDAAGTPMLAGGGTYLIGGANSEGNPVPGRGFGWAAGGGQSLLRSSPGSPAGPRAGVAMILHGYDGVTGDPWANIVNVDWSGSWPVVDLGGGARGAA